MKVNILLFSQTMQSLLASSLSLQDALAVCADILQAKNDREFCKILLLRLNEGNSLSNSLRKYKGQFPPLYTALVSIGEETGSLTEVFSRLSEYLKAKKQMKNKLVQSLAYPILVLITAVAVIMLIIFFVFPRLNDIFEAFAETSAGIEMKANLIKTNLTISFYIVMAIAVFIFLCLILHKLNEKIALLIDSALLHIPVIKKIITIIQIQDFAFSMKLLALTHFPLVQSLSYSSSVVTNRRLKKAVLSVCEGISRGESAGECFAREKSFPKYLTVWVKLAERNGDLASVFSQISDYYSAAGSELTAEITTFAEPVLTMITGLVIIVFMAQIIIPIFNMLGAL